MKTSWAIPALLGASLLAGCSEQTPQTTTETTPNAEQTAPAAPAAAPQADTVQPVTPGGPPARPSQRRDASAVSKDSAPVKRESPTVAKTDEPRWREVEVPANTTLPLELLTAVSSETAKVETPVRARLRQAVVVDGYTAIPAGAVLTGTVIDVARAGRVQGRSRLALRFDEVEVSGDRDELRTNPVTFEGEATKGEDATKVGAGAVGGAIIGGILGGGKGAAKGAAIGSAAGAGVVVATRGREVTLAAGTDVAATLATPFTARVQAR